MKFKDFELTADNHFVAMQYYGLILDRAFLVLLTDGLLIGIKVNGAVSAESPGDPLANRLVSKLVIRGNLKNPRSYIKPGYLEKIQDCELLDGSILAQNSANFVLPLQDIRNVYHDPSKKWGMGYYPHDGKVYVQPRKGRKKEFIILGNQSGERIVQLILTK